MIIMAVIGDISEAVPQEDVFLAALTPREMHLGQNL